MKSYYHTLIVVILISSDTVAIGNKDKKVLSEKEKIQLTQNRSGSGLCFTPNKGQIADMNGNLCTDVLYKGDGGGADIYLRKTGISYVYNNIAEVQHEVHEQVEALIRAGALTEADEHKKEDELMQNKSVKIHRVDMDFANANISSRTTNEDEVNGYQNFYYAHCPNGISNVKQYNKVTYKNMYNNIDVSYYGDKQNGIKYDLIVQPHADPSQIKLHWKGAKSIHINRVGTLVIKTSIDEFTESMPKVYQNINGKIVDVKAKYNLTTLCLGMKQGEVLITFELGDYNHSFPLVIDPWATYYGGSGQDIGGDITTDKTGNVIITGETNSFNFPVIGGTQMLFATPTDAFIVKFNSTGTRIWATFYGGTRGDQGFSIKADNSDNIFITGRTSSPNFPVGAAVTNMIYQNIYGGDPYDAFLVKLNSAGMLLWATFYGGSHWDEGRGVATDNSGSVVITGYNWSAGTFSTGKTGTNIVFQPVSAGNYDAFVIKFDPTGLRLWATLYGGSSTDKGNGVTVDNANNVIIVGETVSLNFPTLPAGGYSQTNAGIDAFIVKFNSFGNRLWATYFGGNGSEGCKDVTIDRLNNIIITGYTPSANFPVVAIGTNIIQQPILGGVGPSMYGDAFLAKFDQAGILQWSTYYGGTPDEWGFGVVTDSLNNIYLLLEAEDAASPDITDACSYQTLFNGGSAINIPGYHTSVEDQIIVKYNFKGKKLCATYIGGTGEDDLEGSGAGSGGKLAIFGNSLYLTGYTDGGYPVTPGAFQTTFNPGSFPINTATDVFVTSLCTNICEGKILGLNYTASSTSVCANVPVTFTPIITNSCDTTGYKFHWVFTGGSPASSDSVNPTVTFSGVGTHDVKLVVTTLCKKDSLMKNNYINITQCAVCNLIGQFTKGTAACTACGCKQWIMINATGGTSPYTYTWPDGYVNRYKNQLCPGVYSINIKDKNGCSINVNLTSP